MRRSFLFVVAMVTSCAARTEVRGGYEVVFTRWNDGAIERYLSSTGEVTLLAPSHGLFGQLRCTYDGRLLAEADFGAFRTSIVDGRGAFVREQQGMVEAIRPDGHQLIVEGLDMPVNESCVGTVDDDGTYAGEQCAPTSQIIDAFAYAPDGKTVVWWTGTDGEQSTLVMARADGSNARVIATADGLLPYQDAAFNRDGSMVAYIVCQDPPAQPHIPCRLQVVRLDTLETHTLVDEGRFLSTLSFAPDGTSIVFFDAGLIDPNALQIPVSLRTVNVTTGAVSTLVEAPNADVFSGLCAIPTNAD